MVGRYDARDLPQCTKRNGPGPEQGRSGQRNRGLPRQRTTVRRDPEACRRCPNHEVPRPLRPAPALPHGSHGLPERGRGPRGERGRCTVLGVRRDHGRHARPALHRGSPVPAWRLGRGASSTRSVSRCAYADRRSWGGRLDPWPSLRPASRNGPHGVGHCAEVRRSGKGRRRRPLGCGPRPGPEVDHAGRRSPPPGPSRRRAPRRGGVDRADPGCPFPPRTIDPPRARSATP